LWQVAAAPEKPSVREPNRRDPINNLWHGEIDVNTLLCR